MAGSAIKVRKPGRKPAEIEDTVGDLRSEPGGTQSVDRALAVLLSFTMEHPVRRVPELTDLLGLNKSTVYRLLQALGAAGLVRREDDGADYRLGPAVLDLANCFLANVSLGNDSRSILEAFARSCGESVTLSVLDGGYAISINQARGNRTPQLVSRLGQRIPVHCSSSGKALLLDHSDASVLALLARSGMEALTDNTITDARLFVERLASERRRGWTLNDEESEIGMRTVGAPIRDHGGAIIAAISVSAPTFRLSKAEVSILAQAVKEAAKDISIAIGNRKA